MKHLLILISLILIGCSKEQPIETVITDPTELKAIDLVEGCWRVEVIEAEPYQTLPDEFILYFDLYPPNWMEDEISHESPIEGLEVISIINEGHYTVADNILFYLDTWDGRELKLTFDSKDTFIAEYFHYEYHKLRGTRV